MRYLPHTRSDIDEMLATIGVASLDDLFEPVPPHLRLDRALDVPDRMSEMALEAHFKGLGEQNRRRGDTPSFLGAGLYDHYVPHVVRQLTLRGEFLTSYTPYQPEVAQGTLQTLFEFQSMVASLLAFEVANASMYDGASGATEGALMALRLTRRTAVAVSAAVHPEYREVLTTYLRHNAELLDPVPVDAAGVTDRDALAALLRRRTDIGAVIVQSPNFFGCIEDLAPIAEICHQAGALLIGTFNEPLAFAVIRPPGAQGADIAAGEAVSLGNAIGYGGPSLGVFAARQEHVRQMPGRLAGQTVDAQGRVGYVLTLSTREQHIRRERATSNICTNQGLCATAAAIYLSLLGKHGLVNLARVNLSKATYAKERLMALPGVSLRYPGSPTFNEVLLELPAPAAQVAAACAERGVLAGVPVSRYEDGRPDELLVAVTELNTKAHIDVLVETLTHVLRG